MTSVSFTRLTNAFSQKLENHKHAIAIYFIFYNYCRVHQKSRVTPAMEARLSDHVWTLEELVSRLLDSRSILHGLVAASVPMDIHLASANLGVLR